MCHLKGCLKMGHTPKSYGLCISNFLVTDGNGKGYVLILGRRKTTSSTSYPCVAHVKKPHHLPLVFVVCIWHVLKLPILSTFQWMDVDGTRADCYYAWKLFILVWHCLFVVRSHWWFNLTP